MPASSFYQSLMTIFHILAEQGEVLAELLERESSWVNMLDMETCFISFHIRNIGIYSVKNRLKSRLPDRGNAHYAVVP